MPQAVKVLLYLLSGVLITPGTLLAIFIYFVNGASDSGNLWGFICFLFDKVLRTAVWAIYLGPFLLVIWLALAFFPRYRMAGSIAVVLVGVASIIETTIILAPPRFTDGLFFTSISLTGIALAGWMIRVDATS